MLPPPSPRVAATTDFSKASIKSRLTRQAAELWGYSEGDLAKSKSYIVSETALADAAETLGLHEFVRVSAGEASTGGRRTV